MPNALTLDNRMNSYTFGVLSSFITELINTLSVHERSYSRVPNTTVGNPYSFFGAFSSYMALFGTRLLNFMKSSFLHFYSEFLAC